MRVLFDALGSTEYSGGMRLHSSEIVQSWSEEFPNDEIAVVSGDWAKKDLGEYTSQIWTWPNDSPVSRSIGQMFITAILARKWQADAVVSLSPIVTPFVRNSPTVCFQHDWRHIRRPEEFPVRQKVYRTLWKWSASWADATACISKKAIEETLSVSPNANVRLIENGRDHARRWGVTGARAFKDASIVTFGHHNNKRPDLVIKAFSLVKRRLPADAKLYVLGARGEWKKALEGIASMHGVSRDVVFPGFVDEAEYQRIVSTAGCIVLASTDEGFGLPIAEAEYFGIPAVITSDSGMEAIFQDSALVSSPNPDALGDAIAIAIKRPRKTLGECRWKWSDCVRQLREVVSQS